MFFVLMKCVNTNVRRLNLFHKAVVVYMSVNPHKRLMSSGLVGRRLNLSCLRGENPGIHAGDETSLTNS